MAQANELFKANSKTVDGLLNSNGEFFYIPAYQRQYNWDSKKVQRLLESTVEGLLGLLTDDNSFAFLGTIIIIQDETHRTIAPLHKADVPPKVFLVIDGQQRLTTLVLLLIALHERLRDAYDKITQTKTSSRTLIHDFLEGEIGTTLELIKSCLMEEKFIGAHTPPAPYVRIIRAYEDAWSKRDNERKYDSPIAAAIYDYGIKNMGFDLGMSRAKYEPRTYPTSHSSAAENRLACGERFKDLRKFLVALKKNGIGEENLSFPPITKFVSNRNICSELLPGLTKEVRDLFLDPALDKGFADSLKDLLLTRFLLQRVALTIVDVKKEEYAFSVFDALNTTGQPLAPFETFKPLVMRSVKLEHYLGSEEKKIVDNIERKLGSLDIVANQTRAMEMTVSFALLENGHKLAKELPEQRNFFRVSYRRVEDDPAARLEFLKYLEAVVSIRESVFDKWKEPKFPGINQNELGVDVLTCLSFLAKLNHTIVLPILARFWIEVSKAQQGNERTSAINELEAIVRAITAFTVLYRAISGSTDGIDDVYRQVMTASNSPTSLQSLCRSAQSYHGEDIDNVSALSAAAVIKDLQSRLTFSKTAKHRGIADKKSFIDQAARVPIYKNLQIARFLVLAALHDNIPDPANAGLVVQGAPNIFPMLKIDLWIDESANTVEHIAPQTNPGAGWDSKIYAPENKDLINMLGNLTLCPGGVNSALGNVPWSRKRVVYNSLGQALPLAVIKRDLATAGFDSLSEKLDEHEVRHVPFFSGIGAKNDDWDADFINSRTKNLLGFAWDRLAPWLGI
jgi:hypothetical protein